MSSSLWGTAEPALDAAVSDVVFARHVVLALPDPAAVLRRWVELLVPGGRFVLVEGRWALVRVLAPMSSGT